MTLAIPRARPMVEYVNDMMAAMMERNAILSKLGNCEKIICTRPKMMINMLLDTLQGTFCPLLWKQLDLLIALFKLKKKR
jgi:hypothetical protein